ncbi:unnamed protein product, partial [Didymodactylos carnosus]
MRRARTKVRLRTVRIRGSSMQNYWTFEFELILRGRARKVRVRIREFDFELLSTSVHTLKFVTSGNTSKDKEPIYQLSTAVADQTTQQRQQQWFFTSVVDHREKNVYIIQSVYNRKALDIPHRSSHDNIKVQQYESDKDNRNQQFKLIHIKKNYCKIVSVATGKALDSRSNDFSISQSKSNLNKDTQLWQLIVSEESTTQTVTVPENSDPPCNNHAKELYVRYHCDSI